MTGRELLEKKNTKYLFTQNGFRFYELGNRFYKLKELDSNVIPADISFKDVLDNVMEGSEKNGI